MDGWYSNRPGNVIFWTCTRAFQYFKTRTCTHAEAQNASKDATYIFQCCLVDEIMFSNNKINTLAVANIFLKEKKICYCVHTFLIAHLS